MLSLTVVKWLKRLPFIAKLSSRTLALWNLLWKPLYWRHCRASGSPADRVSGFFKCPASLDMSQGWEGHTCTDEEDGPGGRHDPCWVPHTGFEILCDEGLLAGSPPVTVLTGLLCPEASAPGLGPVPLGGQHLMIVLWAALSSHLRGLLVPLLGSQALSQKHYERGNVAFKLFLRNLFFFFFKVLKRKVKC